VGKARARAGPSRREGRSLPGGRGEGLRLGDRAPGGGPRTLGEGKGEVVSVSLSVDGKLLAAASPYEPIRLFDPAAGKELRQLKPPPGGTVLSVAVAPDGKTLAAASAKE